MVIRVYSRNSSYLVPDVEVKEAKPEYVYVPSRGFGFSMTVFSPDPKGEGQRMRPIGWILSETLGYPTVKDWIVGTNWKDQGY